MKEKNGIQSCPLRGISLSHNRTYEGFYESHMGNVGLMLVITWEMVIIVI